jgi:hypothetical protein
MLTRGGSNQGVKNNIVIASVIFRSYNIFIAISTCRNYCIAISLFSKSVQQYVAVSKSGQKYIVLSKNILLLPQAVKQYIATYLMNDIIFCKTGSQTQPHSSTFAPRSKININITMLFRTSATCNHQCIRQQQQVYFSSDDSSSSSSVEVERSLTILANSGKLHNDLFWFRKSSACNVFGWRPLRCGLYTRLAIEKSRSSRFEVGSTKSCVDVPRQRLIFHMTLALQFSLSKRQVVVFLFLLLM